MRYAVIKDGICTNIVVSDPQFAEIMGWVLLPEGFNIGDGYENGAFFRVFPVVSNENAISSTQEEPSVAP